MRIFCSVYNISHQYDLHTSQWLHKKYGEENIISYDLHKSSHNTFTIIVNDTNYHKHIEYIFNKFSYFSKKTYIIGHIYDEYINRIFGKSYYDFHFIDILKLKNTSDLFIDGLQNNIQTYENQFEKIKTYITTHVEYQTNDDLNIKRTKNLL